MPAPDPALVLRFRRGLAAPAGETAALAIAVSGGADSLALLLLAEAAFPGRARAATVDHGLRAESEAEAAFVGAVCAARGIPHRTLKASVVPAGEGVQAAAREARYAALGAWMRDEGLPLLLTGHHADDQAETLVMRLLRGSGVGGLAGIRTSAPFAAGGAGARLCRPLLAWRRAELEAIVREAGLEPVADPSNRDEAYDRARLRRLIEAAPWLDPAPLARSAAALAEADQALEAMADRLFARQAEIRDGTAALDPTDLPAELLRRLVLRCLLAVDADASPRGEQITGLLAMLQAGRTATLAGISCRGGPRWHFAKAPPRRA
ncbi:MAG TPA: tRNA lysidine(34) synthetase TilS [Allosphingosinicella sp.]|jgi:tRNA(Ile)-lysidine synthase